MSDVSRGNLPFSQQHGGNPGEAESWLAALMESSLDAIIGKTLEGTITRWNRRAEELYGWTAEEAVGRNISIIAPPELPDEIPNILAALRRGEAVAPHQTVRMRKDGSRLTVSVAVSPLRDERGQVIGAISIARDVTPFLILLEAEARRGERKFRDLFESTSDMILLLSPGGVILDANAHASRLSGYPRHELLGMNLLHDLIAPADRNRVGRVLQSLTDGRPNCFEARGRTKQGEEMFLQGVCSLELDEAGDDGGVIRCVISDLSERRRVETELRNAAQFPEQNPHPVLRISRAGGLLYANRAARKLVEEMGWREGVPLPAPFLEWAAHVLRTQALREMEIECAEHRIFSFVVTPVAGEDYVNFFGRDITDRIMIEKELRQSEQRFVSFMQHLPGAAWMKDLQGRYVWANPEAERIYSQTAESLKGKRDADLFPPETARHFHENDLRALAEGGAIETTEMLQQAQGVEHHTLVHKFVIPGPDGQPAFIGGVAFDITARKQAEEALRAVLQGTSQAVGKDFFQNLARQLALALDLRYALVCELASDNENHVRTLAFWAGDDFSENFEYALENTPCAEVYQREICSIPAMLREAFPQNEYLKKMQIESYIGAPLRDSTSRTIGHLAVMHDRPITDASLAESLLRIFASRAATELERLRYEQKIQEAAQRKDEFLAMLAHELRNPLAPIRNAVHILESIGPRDEAVRRQQSVIDRQVAHMARLLDDLLDVSRVTRGKIAMQERPQVLRDVLAHALETATPLIQARRHDLHFSPPPERLRIRGDFDRLAQVVGNLLSNAAKYTETGGQIWLEAGRESGSAVVRVRDTGVGIAPEMQPRIFDLFAQADVSLARAQGGLGIGLTMVQKLVELHGGTVEVRSEGLGMGSEFVVRLPALPEEAWAEEPEAQAPESAAGPARPRRVLVVDDIADSAESLAELLGLWGHETRVARDGAAALKEAEAFRPEVALLDIGMPGMDGYEVARHLRAAHGREVLLVALTGYGQTQDREATREAGFDAHLVKPVDLAELQSLLCSRKSS